MGTHVDTVELTRLSTVTLALPPGTTEALVLLRWHGMPIGLVQIGHDDLVSIERTRSRIASQAILPVTVPSPLHRAAPITVVVCTRERPEDLTRCLDSLRGLAADGHDLLVVDNAPTSPDTRAITSRYPVRYVCEPEIGLNNARNRGLSEARHALVAYVDDDAVVDRDWANAIAEPFADPQIGCSTGLVVPRELRTSAQQVFETYAAHRRVFERREFSASTLRPAAAGVVGIGANMAIRRDLACKIGGFDPRLDAGTPTCSGGDNDMFARILDTGAGIVYTARALVWHRHRDTDLALRQCIFGYGVGVFAFLTKRVVEHRDLDALPVAARWLVGPFIREARRRFEKQETLPWQLLMLEAGGSLAGPFRWIAAQRRQRANGNDLGDRFR